MKAEKLSAWLSLGANLAVLVGLILLIIEIRQNTDMMESQIHQSRTETALSEQQAVFNSDYMPAILTKVANEEPLTPEEERRYVPYFRAFNRNMDNQLWQYSHGFLGENIPRSIGNAVQAVIGGTQVGMEQWERMKLQFTDEYIAFVDSVLSASR